MLQNYLSEQLQARHTIACTRVGSGSTFLSANLLDAVARPLKSYDRNTFPMAARECSVLLACVITLLLVLTAVPAAGQQDLLGLIAPGLTADKLCPLIKSDSQTAINAIAAGATRAYDEGGQAVTAFANAMGAAVIAANSNGCINEVFEGVNQAIIKGGYKVEYVTGKALALGVSQGVASEGGEILAKATAVVICRGGASASACAKAWNQAIKFDPKNGCAVLVQAYVHAQAYCTQGKAYTNVKSTVFKTPLGECRAPGLSDNNNGGAGGVAAGSFTPQGSMSITQGARGQTVTYPDGTTITQGPGVSASVWAHNGDWGRSGAANYIYQGSDGQRVFWGRKMLSACRVPAYVTAAKRLFDKLQLERAEHWQSRRIGNSGDAASVAQARKLHGTGQYGGNSYYGNTVTANNLAQSTNNGYAAGGVFANSQSLARESTRNTGSGYWWCPWCNSRVTSNSAAVASNNGYTNGPVVANSMAVAEGRR